MAEHAQYPIDVVELWGPEGESGLTPAAPFSPAPDLYRVDTKYQNGSGESTPAVDNQALDEVARPAAALAANHSDVVRTSDLDAMRAEIASTFSQQLADHISDRVTRSVDAQAGVLRSSVEANHHAVLEIAEMVRSELAAFRGQLTGVEGLTSFQRDIRHDVARLGDLAAMPPAASAETGDLLETMRVMRAELAELRQEVFRLRGSMAVPAPAE